MVIAYHFDKKHYLNVFICDLKRLSHYHIKWILKSCCLWTFWFWRLEIQKFGECVNKNSNFDSLHIKLWVSKNLKQLAAECKNSTIHWRTVVTSVHPHTIYKLHNCIAQLKWKGCSREQHISHHRCEISLNRRSKPRRIQDVKDALIF